MNDRIRTTHELSFHIYEIWKRRGQTVWIVRFRKLYT